MVKPALVIGLILVSILSCVAVAQVSPQVAPMVTIMRVPNGGIEPQVVVDPAGTVHLIYFTGDPKGGDLMYSKSSDDGASFSTPIQINGQPKSAIAAGSVRGPHLAVGKGNRVHVSWNGSDVASPRGPKSETPVLYSRLNDEGTAFEPQRNMVQQNFGIDGGCSVAADGEGNVYVAWHGASEGHDGEPYRKVWVAKSSDEGKTFGAERTAMPYSKGICACCGLRAFADRQGTHQGNNCKHPVLAVNGDGQILVGWTEGTAWGKGGEAAWQIYSRDGSALLEKNGQGSDLPVWGTVAAFARRDGGFVIAY